MLKYRGKCVGFGLVTDYDFHYFQVVVFIITTWRCIYILFVKKFGGGVNEPEGR